MESSSLDLHENIFKSMFLLVLSGFLLCKDRIGRLALRKFIIGNSLFSATLVFRYTSIFMLCIVDFILFLSSAFSLIRCFCNDCSPQTNCIVVAFFLLPPLSVSPSSLLF